MGKKCSTCSFYKTIDDFYKNKSSADGFRNNCKDCEKARKKEYYTRDEIREREKLTKARYRDDPHNKAKAVSKTREWYRNNRDRVREYVRLNRRRINANNMKYIAAKINATIDGYDEEIKKIYDECPSGYHVDHIVPLRGKTVCGLHVPWNLQHLPAKENIRKSNKYE